MNTKSNLRPADSRVGRISRAEPRRMPTLSPAQFSWATAACLGLISIEVTFAPVLANQMVEYPPRVPISRMFLAPISWHCMERNWPWRGEMAMGGRPLAAAFATALSS